MSGAYKKCDCCGQLKKEEELEEITITILKCPDCDLSKAPILEETTARPTLKALGGQDGAKPFNAYSRPPASVAGAFNPPPLD